MSNIIYKYLPIERLTYFKDELLRITQPSDLNDPFECLPAPPSKEDFITALHEIRSNHSIKIKKGPYLYSEKEYLLKKLFHDIDSCIENIKNDTSDNLRSSLYKRAINTINKSMGIISLSKRWNSTLMWSHYTNSHKGMCVGFNSSSSYFNLYKKFSNSNIIFMPVIYDENRLKIPITKYGKIDPNVILTKSKEWQYEEEERLIVPLKKSKKCIKSIPYDIYLYKVPHKLIREIIVGANILEENLNVIKEFCNNKTIDLYQCKLSEYKFDMIRVQI